MSVKKNFIEKYVWNMALYGCETLDHFTWREKKDGKPLKVVGLLPKHIKNLMGR